MSVLARVPAIHQSFLCTCLIALVLMMQTGCQSAAIAQTDAASSPLPIPQTVTPSRTPTATITRTPTLTPTITPTSTPEIRWVEHAPGSTVTMPILAYHHVAEGDHDSPYYVTVDNFRQQMQALHDWGYTTISTEELASVLRNGGPLPERPVIITFDDGDLDVYENAFPIMRNLHQRGTLYIVGNRLECDVCIQTKQLKEMIAEGWEIGSHTMSHADLLKPGKNLQREIFDSRKVLENALGIPVHSLAYPFAIAGANTFYLTSLAGYDSAMGVGILNDHNLNNIYYLSRRTVTLDMDMDAFARLLPWTGKPQ